jgi:predicted transcriptional regulator
LELRVSDEFARKLERMARLTGHSMGAVLEAVGTPALDDALADARFEAEALAAWEAYQVSGVSVGNKTVERQFAAAAGRARVKAPNPVKRCKR